MRIWRKGIKAWGGNELAVGKKRAGKEVDWRTLTPVDSGRTCPFNWVEMKSYWWVLRGDVCDQIKIVKSFCWLLNGE